MSEAREIILTTEDTGQLWKACVWDPRTGTALMTYKGKEAVAAGPRSACFLGDDYLLMSDKTKPVIHYWPLNSQQPSSNRFVCPGKVNAMAVTPNGFFVVTAIGEKLHVWLIESGRHLAVAQRHFQPVTCVKFTDDGSHFISGGDDGQVLVWSMENLLSSYSGEFYPEQSEPHFMFSDHALPVKDIFVGIGGMRAQVVSVSADKSCRIYDLSSGQLLAAVIFDNSLSAVAMNAIQTLMFVGSLNGNIYQFNLGSLPRTREHHVTDKEKGNVFVGHSKLVTCLSVSKDGAVLLSGAHDKQVILWDIPSRQSIRTIEHKGVITNAFFALAPKHIFSEDFKPSLVLTNFKNNTDENQGDIVFVARTTKDCWYDEDNDILDSQPQIPTDDGSELKEKFLEIQKKNADLYKFAMEKILKPFQNTAENETNEEKMETEDKSGDNELPRAVPRKKMDKKNK